MNRYEFELLKFLEKKGNQEITYCARTFSDQLNISGTQLNESLDLVIERGWVEKNGNDIKITSAGIDAIMNYVPEEEK